jgi:hypothetical protein
LAAKPYRQLNTNSGGDSSPPLKIQKKLVASTRDCSRIYSMLRKYSKEKMKWFKISKQQQRLND